jgi:carotenoid cleavage dioxygenase-like enzyme
MPGGPITAPITALGANINVLTHAGRTLALVEGCAATYELTDELGTIGPCDFDGTLPGGYTATIQRCGQSSGEMSSRRICLDSVRKPLTVRANTSSTTVHASMTGTPPGAVAKTKA